MSGIPCGPGVTGESRRSLHRKREGALIQGRLPRTATGGGT